jgi:hypothetical protein
MKNVRGWLLIGVLVLVGGLVATRVRDAALAPEPLAPENAPQKFSVLLIRGDYDPGCQEIYDLVDEAEASYQESIAVLKADWSADNPWIEKYDIITLPTVVFIDPNGDEINRVVGEGSAVKATLEKELAAFKTVATQ